MAILHIKKENTYSIIDNIIINKTNKNLVFELVVYENEDKLIELDRKQYNINANIICRKVTFYFNGHGDLSELTKNVKETYIQNLNPEEINIILANYGSLFSIFNYENIIRPCILKFRYDKDTDKLFLDYEEDTYYLYYYHEHSNQYYRYSEDKTNFYKDPIQGIGTDIFFNNNILPYIQDHKNIIEICYKILKIIDKELLLYTVDV